MKVNIENKSITFDVQYGKRKKISIHIDATGFITLKVPKNTSQEALVKVVEEKSEWIFEKLSALQQTEKISQTKAYHEQEKFLHLGKVYCLDELIALDGLGEEEAKRSLKKFYINSCKKVIDQRLKRYEKQLGVKPKAVEIVSSNTHWGSCSSDKKITFNYRLAMAPVEVIDYVVIHELCHLIHMNHDRSFWRRVGSIMPDYKSKQEFLASYGPYLTL